MSTNIRAIVKLREATWSCHQRLEKRLDIRERLSSASLYRSHLAQMWGFFASLEQIYTAQSFALALSDFELRRKLPLLSSDLITLGTSRKALLDLPLCHDVPEYAEPAAALGGAYVLEGSTLGGRTLLKLVRNKLGYTPTHGAQFLAGYGEQTSAMWQTFTDAFDTWCATDTRYIAAEAAALATFSALEFWLCGQEI